MEGNTGRSRGVQSQQNTGVPGDGFAFAVIVGPQIDLGGRGGFAAEGGDGFGLRADGFVGGHPGGAESDGGQVLFKGADVAHGGADTPAVTQDFLDFLTFGGGLHN